MRVLSLLGVIVVEFLQLWIPWESGALHTTPFDNLWKRIEGRQGLVRT